MRQAGRKWTVADLPRACNLNNLFRKRFIPTYIKFVAEGSDLWTVDDLAAVTAMQQIWNTVYGKTIPYRISTDGPDFTIVRKITKFELNSYCLFQAQQRTSDSWHSVIGSTGLAVTNALFESKTDLTTDDERKTFTKDGLKDLKFLYSNTTAEDPQACVASSQLCP